MSEMKIKTYTQIEAIRNLPGMYIGDTSGISRLLGEVVDNSIDEALNGFASIISIDYDKKKGQYSVLDNGRGIPADDLELVFEQLHSSGKFDKDAYSISCGLHGVGLKVCTALSTKCIVIVKNKNGKSRKLVYENQKKTYDGKDEDNILAAHKSGTYIEIHPDKTIFDSIKYDIDESCFYGAMVYAKKLNVYINGNLLEHKDFTLSSIYGKLLYEKSNEVEFDYNGDDPVLNGTKFRIAYNWSKHEHDLQMTTTVNSLSVAHGVHITWLKNILSKTIAQKAKLDNDKDCALGLRVIAHILTTKVEFGGQNKEKLTKAPNLNGCDAELRELITKSLRGFDFTELENKILAYKEAMNKLSNHELVKKKVVVNNKRQRSVAQGVFECTRPDLDSELIIVEGRSAAGGLVMKRDVKTQAIMPLRGKVLNVSSKDDLERSLNNKEICAMVNAFGSGIFPNENPEFLRYNRIIIGTDADSDGLQITALLIGFLAKMTPEIIKAGNVYVCYAPLYKQDGKFIWDESELNKRANYQRYKGLGEMNPDELKTAMLDAKTRRLERVIFEDDLDKDEIIRFVGQGGPKKELLIERKLVEKN